MGGSAQTKAVKSVAGTLRLSLAQFRELAAFAQFSTDLDQETKQRIQRGQRLTELLKQPQFSPMSVWQQTAALMATTAGEFDHVPVEKIKDAEKALLTRLHSESRKLMTTLDKGDKPSDEIKNAILKAAKSVASSYKVEKPKEEEVKA